MLWLCLWRTRWRLFGLPLILLGLGSAAFDRPPDLLVSGDARLIGLRADEALFLQRLSGASNITRDNWHRLYGDSGSEALPRQGERAAGAIRCSAGACIFQPGPEMPSAVLLRGDPPREACSTAALVVSAEPVRGSCTAQVIDRFAVWRNGAHAIWLDPAGLRIVNDRGYRGGRPWVPPIPRARGTPSMEPRAPSE